MPASSAMTASFLLSGQLPDQRSGTSVTARPDEQFGPNRPICNLLPEYIDRRAAREASWAETCGACTVIFLISCHNRSPDCTKCNPGIMPRGTPDFAALNP